jgi:SpoVK/Ycf46/Vps4 family AAA+-type ATPase
VYIDDLDRVLQEPQIGNGLDRRLTYAVVSVIDKVLSHPGVVVIGAVRDVASVPPFLRAAHRLAHTIEIRPPSVEQKIEIVQAITRSMKPTKQAVDSIATDERLVSGADLRMRIDTAILNQVSAILSLQKADGSSLTIEQIQSIVIDPENRRGGVVRARSGPFRPPQKPFPTPPGSSPDPFALSHPPPGAA